MAWYQHPAFLLHGQATLSGKSVTEEASESPTVTVASPEYGPATTQKLVRTQRSKFCSWTGKPQVGQQETRGSQRLPDTSLKPLPMPAPTKVWVFTLPLRLQTLWLYLPNQLPMKFTLMWFLAAKKLEETKLRCAWPGNSSRPMVLLVLANSDLVLLCAVFSQPQRKPWPAILLHAGRCPLPPTYTHTHPLMLLSCSKALPVGEVGS